MPLFLGTFIEDISCGVHQSLLPVGHLAHINIAVLDELCDGQFFLAERRINLALNRASEFIVFVLLFCTWVLDLYWGRHLSFRIHYLIKGTHRLRAIA